MATPWVPLKIPSFPGLSRRWDDTPRVTGHTIWFNGHTLGPMENPKLSRAIPKVRRYPKWPRIPWKSKTNGPRAAPRFWGLILGSHGYTKGFEGYFKGHMAWVRNGSKATPIFWGSKASSNKKCRASGIQMKTKSLRAIKIQKIICFALGLMLMIWYIGKWQYDHLGPPVFQYYESLTMKTL